MATATWLVDSEPGFLFGPRRRTEEPGRTVENGKSMREKNNTGVKIKCINVALSSVWTNSGHMTRSKLTANERRQKRELMLTLLRRATFWALVLKKHRAFLQSEVTGAFGRKINWTETKWILNLFFLERSIQQTRAFRQVLSVLYVSLPLVFCKSCSRQVFLKGWSHSLFMGVFVIVDSAESCCTFMFLFNVII